MPNDQFGNPVAVGDTVTVAGVLTVVDENPTYLNCTVLLDQPLPPTMSETNIRLNTQQVVKQPPSAEPAT